MPDNENETIPTIGTTLDYDPLLIDWERTCWLRWRLSAFADGKLEARWLESIAQAIEEGLA